MDSSFTKAETRFKASLPYLGHYLIQKLSCNGHVREEEELLEHKPMIISLMNYRNYIKEKLILSTEQVHKLAVETVKR